MSSEDPLGEVTLKGLMCDLNEANDNVQDSSQNREELLVRLVNSLVQLLIHEHKEIIIPQYFPSLKHAGIKKLINRY